MFIKCLEQFAVVLGVPLIMGWSRKYSRGMEEDRRKRRESLICVRSVNGVIFRERLNIEHEWQKHGAIEDPQGRDVGTLKGQRHDALALPYSSPLPTLQHAPTQ
jgi:hypothetical protein